MTREKTTDEVRAEFLEQMWDCIDSWDRTLPPDLEEKYTLRDRLQGLMHSVLATLDGCSGLPAFIVAPDPHPGDKAYRKADDSDWFPENHRLLSRIKADIGGGLHERFYHDFERRWKSKGE